MDRFLFHFALVLIHKSACNPDATERTKGGRPVIHGDFSFSASIQRKGSHVCTGVLVDRGWLLTLRECINERSLGQYTVIFTTDNDKNRNVKRTVRYVEVPDIKDDRVILARLNIKLRRRRDGVRPFDRFTSSKIEEKLTRCKAVGYSSSGRSQRTGIQIQLQSGKKCKGSKKETTLCFDNVNGKLCQTDNGSPIVCKLNNKWYLTGMSSVAADCKDERISGFRLSYFRKGIIETIAGKARGCGDLPEIPDGTVSIDKQQVVSDIVSTATVRCNPGFETDSSTLFCQEDGQWTSSTCKIMPALFGEPCVLDDQCVDVNNVCNGTCVCNEKSLNITGDCTACTDRTCAENPSEECVVCTKKRCSVESAVTVVSVYNNVTVERLKSSGCNYYEVQHNPPTYGKCTLASSSDVDYTWKVFDGSVCTVLSPGCIFRVTPGTSIFAFYEYC